MTAALITARDKTLPCGTLSSVRQKAAMLYQLFIVPLLAAAVTADFHLLLLHTNDIHARFQQTDRFSGHCESDESTACYGGFARLHSQVGRLKHQAAERGRSSLYLDAGDVYQGSPFYIFFKWPIVVQFVNLLTHLDVMALGNHEFDDGVEGLAPFVAHSRVPIVCANLNTSLEPALDLPNLTASKVFTLNGTKVGVIGYLTPDTKYISITGNLQILDEITSVRAEAKRLSSEGVKVIIALGHSGFNKDQQIAREVEEVDVVVGGHTNNFLYNGTPPDREEPSGPYPTVVSQPSGKLVPVVQAYYATKYLGYLELDFDDLGNLKSFNGSPILLSGDLFQDPVILHNLRKYERQMPHKIRRPIGHTDVLIDRSNCKYEECNVGNLITDAYVDYVARRYKNAEGWTLAAIGIVNAGHIRGTIDTHHQRNSKGSLVLGDVMAVLWSDSMVIINMTGSALREALEFSVDRYGDKTATFSKNLQFSGLQVVYDLGQPAGSRVASVMVRCADCRVPKYSPLVSTQSYRVIMSEYLAKGGSNYTVFSSVWNTHKLLDDPLYIVLAKYIKSHYFIYPAIEGRITFLNRS